MLVLARRIGESVVFPGCSLTVTVLRIDGAKVRLGIEAPPDVEVHREEVWFRKNALIVNSPSEPASREVHAE